MMNKPSIPCVTQDLKAFCDRLDWAMRNRGINQRKLAGQIGVAQSHVSSMLKGKTHPSRDVAHRLSEALGYRVEWLVFGVGEPDNNDGQTSSPVSELALLVDAVTKTYESFNSPAAKYAWMGLLYNHLNQGEQQTSEPPVKQDEA